MAAEHKKGIVSTYSVDLGRGLILSQDGEQSTYLIDFRQISPGVGPLRAGEMVTFEIENDDVRNVAPI